MKFRFQPTNPDDAPLIVDAPDFDEAIKAASLAIGDGMIAACEDAEATIVGMRLDEVSPTIATPSEIRSFKLVYITHRAM